MTDERSAVSGPLDEMRKLEDALLALLPIDGSAVGNTFLRRELGTSESEYWSIRDSLVSRRIVGVGRGRGGSTFKVVTAGKVPADNHGSPLDPVVTEASRINEHDGPSLASETPTASLPTFRPTIQTIKVENFKRIESVSIKLSPVTILVGGNNAGKSSFLQAVHTAISCAQESERQGQKVVSEANLRFAPTHDFALLGHGAPYENRSQGSRGRVTFTGFSSSDLATSVNYTIEMYKGANHKNVGVDRIGERNEFGKVISDPQNLFSVYVPGLSGILLNEETHGYPSLFMRAARGDANLVFRNIIERLLLDNKGPKLEDFLGGIFGHRVELRLFSNPDTDLYVDVRLARGDNPLDADFLPVELWGMGMLQVTQLFAYALLFEPDLLLVDEPDSHVHPAGQKLLMVTLDRIANDIKCRVVLSTHSRHVVDASPEGATIVWMKDGGAVEGVDGDVIPALLDIGALDRFDMTADVVVATEDKDSAMLKSAILPGKGSRRIDVVELKGINNAFMAMAFGIISNRVKHGPSIVIHRDRDFLTNDEMATWSKPFRDEGVHVFSPKLCDVESYFATAEHLAQVTGMSFGDATRFRSSIVQNKLQHFREKFDRKRMDANSKLWPEGGSPLSESLWPTGTDPSEEHIYGKDLLGFLKTEMKKSPIYRSSAESLVTTPSKELEEEFSVFVERLTE